MIQKKKYIYSFFISDVISTTTTESLIDSVFDSIDTTTANAITSTTPKGKLYES